MTLEKTIDQITADVVAYDFTEVEKKLLTVLADQLEAYLAAEEK